MNYLNYGIRFVFTKDYKTATKSFKKGDKCNILNGVVVINNQGDFLFDVDSNLARKFGKVVN